MRSLLHPLLLAALALTISACSSDNPVDSRDDAGLIGKWRILTSNGVDITFAGGTLDISENRIVESWQLLSCTKTYSYTKDGSSFSTTLQSTNCQQGSDPSNVVGYQASGTYKISKNKLTLNHENGTVSVSEKI